MNNNTDKTTKPTLMERLADGKQKAAEQDKSPDKQDRQAKKEAR